MTLIHWNSYSIYNKLDEFKFFYLNNGICISNWKKEKIILQERAIITLPKYY